MKINNSYWTKHVHADIYSFRIVVTVPIICGSILNSDLEEHKILTKAKIVPGGNFKVYI